MTEPNKLNLVVNVPAEGLLRLVPWCDAQSMF